MQGPALIPAGMRLAAMRGCRGQGTAVWMAVLLGATGRNAARIGTQWLAW